MDDRVDDHFAESGGRNVPAIGAPHRPDHRFPRRVLLNECNGLLESSGQVAADLGAVHDPGSVLAGKSARLDPGIRKAVETILGEENISTHGGHLMLLVPGSHPEGPERRGRKLSQGCEQLGSNSEVECFSAQLRDGLLVEGAEIGKAAHLLHLGRVGAAVGRADTHENALVGSEPREVVRARPTGIDPRRQHLLLTPR